MSLSHCTIDQKSQKSQKSQSSQNIQDNPDNPDNNRHNLECLKPLSEVMSVEKQNNQPETLAQILGQAAYRMARLGVLQAVYATPAYQLVQWVLKKFR